MVVQCLFCTLPDPLPLPVTTYSFLTHHHFSSSSASPTVALFSHRTLIFLLIHVSSPELQSDTPDRLIWEHKGTRQKAGRVTKLSQNNDLLYSLSMPITVGPLR